MSLDDLQMRRTLTTKIAEHMRLMRAQKGFTQKQMAAWLGISQSAVSKIEREIKLPSLREASRLAQMTQTTLHKLCYGQDYYEQFK